MSPKQIMTDENTSTTRVPALHVLERMRRKWIGIQATDARFIQAVRAESQNLKTDGDADLREYFNAIPAELTSTNAIQTFAAVDNALQHTLGFCLHDCQLLAGLALTRKAIAEMATGEGKTLVTFLVACFFCKAKRGVHVMTTNAYLAHRDYSTLLPTANLLGVTLGLLPDNPQEDASKAYQADVTYGPSHTFGFDFLRDAVKLKRGRSRIGDKIRERLTTNSTRFAKESDSPSSTQRELAFAIVDEADSVLIDEASVPLHLSESTPGQHPHVELFARAQQVAEHLIPSDDFTWNARNGELEFTSNGLRVIQQYAPQSGAGLNHSWQHYLKNALLAMHRMERDRDYVISDDKIQLVDQFTGRIQPDRSWSDALQQAVECKEGLMITSENRCIASISRQRFIRLYDHVVGLTGTANDASRELKNVYGLRVEKIPPNKPSRLHIGPPRFFVSTDTKRKAIVDATLELSLTGRPVLIGTKGIGDSCQLAELFYSRGIRPKVLNGLQDAEEAEIIRDAGAYRSILIATNMAGRGTDIPISDEISDVGGLHVIVAEPNLSRRIDRQLIGRAARQGQNGSAQIFCSLEDELLVNFAKHLALPSRSKSSRRADLKSLQNGEIPELALKDIEEAQKLAEALASEQRASLARYDDWVLDFLQTVTD